VRILLAGGAGFVGSHLAARLLDQGHQLSIVDNLITGRAANLHALETNHAGARLDIRIEDVCALSRFDDPLDAVLHLASPASPVDYLRHPVETLEAGATATRRLLEIARAKSARFLLASTSEVYGDPLEHPQHETYWGHVNPVGPRSVYDEAKRFAEAMATAYARHHGTAVRIACIFNTYGPGMRLDDGRIVPTFISQALRGESITVFGSGSQTRSFCYVDDLVSGLLALLWSDVEGPVNLGAPDEHTVLEMAHYVIQHTNSSSTILHLRLPDDDPRVRRPSIERARLMLGWEPRTTLKQGIAHTVRDLAARLAAGEPANGSNGTTCHGNGDAKNHAIVPEVILRSRSADGVAGEAGRADRARG